jgi:hypothetical protein
MLYARYHASGRSLNPDGATEASATDTDQATDITSGSRGAVGARYSRPAARGCRGPPPATDNTIRAYAIRPLLVQPDLVFLCAVAQHIFP